MDARRFHYPIDRTGVAGAQVEDPRHLGIATISCLSGTLCLQRYQQSRRLAQQGLLLVTVLLQTILHSYSTPRQTHRGP